MINIAELLKDAPNGMKLYSPLFGEVKFVKIDKSNYPIVVTDCKGNGKSFTEFGVYFEDHPDAECLIFPSKECRTWENIKLTKHNFKAKDWVVYNGASVWQVDRIDRNMPIPRYELTNNDGDKLSVPFTSEYNLKEWSIKDAKDGDVLYSLDSKQPFIYKVRPQFSQAIGYCCINKFGDFAVWNTNKCIICTDKYIPATKEQCDLLFTKMKEAGYQWDAEKKELRKIKHYDIAKFKPFDKVLVRDADDRKWRCNWFSHYSGDGGVYRFVTTKCGYAQCIPFEGNEHLLGTTDMCDEMYVNW